MLEIELPETEGPGSGSENPEKTVLFEKRNEETGIKVCLFQVPMELLTDGKNVSFEEYYALYEQYHRTRFCKECRETCGEKRRCRIMRRGRKL